MPSGGDLVEQVADKGGRALNFVRQWVRRADDVVDVAKGSTDNGVSILRSFKQLPKPPASTSTSTAPPDEPTPTVARQAGDSPTPGDIVSGVALGAAATWAGIQLARQRSRERKARDDQD